MDGRLRVEVDGRPLEIAAAVREGGEDLVLLLHGLGCDRTTWRDALAHRALAHATLVAPDLPGFGETESPTWFPDTMEAHARVVEALLATFPERRFHVVAHSMGGVIGMLLNPQILAEAASFVNVEGNLIAADCGLISREAAAVSEETFVSEIFPSWRERFAEAEGKYLALSRCSPRAFHRCAVSLVEWSDGGRLLPIFRGLRCRKAYVYGERNRGLEVIPELGGIETIEIPDSGHFSMVDDADGFYGQIGRFMEGWRGSSDP